MDKKLCIIKNNRELLKIIPFKDKDSTGFKVIIRRPIEVIFHHINYSNLAHVGLLRTTDPELCFTYHTSGGKLKANLHLKLKNSFKKKYSNVPYFSDLAEISEHQIIPIPLCKIVCNDSSIFPEHHNKKKNVQRVLGEIKEHNIDNHNVAEIYVMRPNYKVKYDELYAAWNLFFMTMNILPIEYLSVPTPENTSFKADSMGNGRNLISSVIDDFNDKVSFMVCTYFSKGSVASSQNSFSLFENGKHLEHLALTRLCYKDESGVQSETKRLYQWQLEANRKKLTDDEFNYWQAYFKQAENEIAPNLRTIIMQSI